MNKKMCFIFSLIMMLTFVLVACGNHEEVFSENSSSDTTLETQNNTENDASEDIPEETIENTKTDNFEETTTSEEFKPETENECKELNKQK